MGLALRSLPEAAAAFAKGELSYDKVCCLVRVATPADDAAWTELARQASASQLARICRAFRQALEADDAEARLVRRGVWGTWREDGMLRLAGLLPAEDGAVVMAALEAAAARRSGSEAGPDLDPADDPWAARRADALVELCRGAGPSPAQVVVHVDVGVLSGEAPGGRCEIESGAALGSSAAARLACDGELVRITERDGLPIDAGRARRAVSTPLRRALHARDRGCRFPGCATHVHRVEAHHVQHWARGGRTDLANLVSLCGFHHRRLHDGAYRIEAGRFVTADGRPIRPQARRVDPGIDHLRTRCFRLAAPITADTPGALSGGPCDVGLAVEGMLWERSRAGP